MICFHCAGHQRVEKLRLAPPLNKILLDSRVWRGSCPTFSTLRGMQGQWRMRGMQDHCGMWDMRSQIERILI